MSEAEAIAARAGLVHRTDDRPGIRRRRRGRGFSYEHDNGRPVAAAARRRIATLAIPPAWRDVWIAPEGNAHLQATGFDAAGRKQYRYHPDWTEATAVEKFQRLAAIAEHLPDLRKQVAADLETDGPARPVATVVRLIDRALIRPGSGRSSEAVGATTLEVGHIEIEQGRIVLDFVGKSAVEQHVEIDDPDLAAALTALLARSTLEDVQVFAACVDGAVNASRVNRYLAECTDSTVTAKDLRTWGATAAAVECLCDPPSCTDRPSDPVRRMLEDVSGLLGNTVAVCRTSYVAPVVVDAFADGTLEAAWRDSRKSRWLSRPERTLTRVLTGG